MRVLLINPPLISTETISAAIPYLLASLEKNNIDTKVVDFNIEFLRYILSNDYLNYTKELLLKIYQNPAYINECVNTKYHLTEKQRYFQNSLIYDCLYKNRDTIDKIINNSDNLYERFISAIKTGDINKINYYSILIEKATKFAFLPFYPEQIQIYPFSVKLNPLYSYTYESLIDKSENIKRNIYIKPFCDILNKINIDNFDVAAISITHSSNFFPALTLSKILKMNTNLNVAIGGTFVNTTIDSFIKHHHLFGSFFDVILEGSGENSLPQYVKSVERSEYPFAVDGAIYKQGTQIVRNKNNNDSKLIIPSYTGINLSEYSTNKVNIQFSKGCYWGKCLFCYSKKNINSKPLCPIHAVNIIKFLQENYGISEFGIVDNAIEPEFLNQFSTALLDENIKISYTVYMRFDKNLNFDLLLKAYKSGLKTIFFGLESASKRIINLFNKGIDLNTVKIILDSCKEIGILVKMGLIYGFPTETNEDFEQTISFIAKNKDKITNLSCNKFVLLKNSKIILDNLLDKLNISNVHEHAEFSTYLLYDAPTVSNYLVDKFFAENNLGVPSKKINW